MIKPGTGSLTPVQVQWLALIRYQVSVADQQSRQPMPLSMLGINTLHDAVESMLGLIVEVQNLPEPKGNGTFMELFGTVTADQPGLSGHRGKVRDLNDTRNGFKHHNRYADAGMIERLRVNGADFLAEAARIVLDVDLATISLTALITEQIPRLLVERAEKHWRDGEGDEALADLRRAFDAQVKSYERSKSWDPYRSVFDTRPPSGGYTSAKARQASALGAFGDPVNDHLEKWLQALDERVKLIGLGVDMRRWAYLDAHAPEIHYTSMTPEGRTHRREGVPEPRGEVFQRCHRFVIDTALALGAEDFTFDAWAARQAARES
jgi:hypothetical protein